MVAFAVAVVVAFAVAFVVVAEVEFAVAFVVVVVVAVGCRHLNCLLGSSYVALASLEFDSSPPSSS